MRPERSWGTPTGEIYCAFTLVDAVKFKGEAQMYRRKKIKWTQNQGNAIPANWTVFQHHLARKLRAVGPNDLTEKTIHSFATQDGGRIVTQGDNIACFGM